MDKKEKEKVSVDENSLQFKEEGEKNVMEKTVMEKQTNVNTTEDSHHEEILINYDGEENEMNNGAGLKEDENLLEKSNNNEMIDKDEKQLEELGGDELSNLGVDDDVAYEKLKELSETSSQMIEKIKDFLVSKEENEQEDNAGDVLTK